MEGFGGEGQSNSLVVVFNGETLAQFITSDGHSQCIFTDCISEGTQVGVFVCSRGVEGRGGWFCMVCMSLIREMHCVHPSE